MTHDFSVLRAAIFLKFVFKSKHVLPSFFFVISKGQVWRSNCGWILSGILIFFAHTRQENLQIQCIIKMDGSIMCYHLLGHTSGDLSPFWWSIPHPPPPHPPLHSKRQLSNPWRLRRPQVRHFAFNIDVILIYEQLQNQTFCQQYIPYFF